MDEEPHFWRANAGPVLVSFGVFATMNALWNNFRVLSEVAHLALAVFLVGSVVALGFLWIAIRNGRLTPRDAGLAITGWTAPKRLLGLALVLFFGYGSFTSIQPATGPTDSAGARGAAEADEEPTVPGESPAAIDAASPAPGNEQSRAPVKADWADYCFWFVFLLSASLTELLVFVSVGFCLPESYLKKRGLPAWTATALAAVFASVSFGLYHFTHPSIWWNYVFFPLMPVMLLNISLFVATRNFYLVFVLHNAFAAVGFTTKQYSQYPFDPRMDPATFQDWQMLTPNLAAFVVPFLLLHVLEGVTYSRRPESPS